MQFGKLLWGPTHPVPTCRCCPFACLTAGQSTGCQLEWGLLWSLVESWGWGKTLSGPSEALLCRCEILRCAVSHASPQHLHTALAQHLHLPGNLLGRSQPGAQAQRLAPGILMLRPAIFEARALVNMLLGFLGLCFLPWALAPDISGAHGLHDDERYATEMVSTLSVGPGSCHF